jgi:glycosyltransferase involved in cell wall biosynthesis
MISICMATYNGEQFISRQLDSVLKQLSPADQVIVVDDGSTDGTVRLLKDKYSSQVEVHVNNVNLGVIKSFEKAISMAEGEIIFLCDQDDEWEDKKVETVLKAFENGADLVVHDAVVVDGNDKVIHPSWNEYNHNNMNQNVFGNIIKNAYTGCMMAFKRDFVSDFVPFPSSIEMHDQWIALVAMMNNKKVVYIKEALMKYVRHGSNVTGMKKRSLTKQVAGRAGTIKAVMNFKKG